MEEAVATAVMLLGVWRILVFYVDRAETRRQRQAEEMTKLISEYEKRNEKAHTELDERVSGIGTELKTVRADTHYMRGRLDTLVEVVSKDR